MTVLSTLKVNKEGGFFKNGTLYDIVKKTEVAAKYYQLQQENAPTKSLYRTLYASRR